MLQRSLASLSNASEGCAQASDEPVGGIKQLAIPGAFRDHFRKPDVAMQFLLDDVY